MTTNRGEKKRRECAQVHATASLLAKSSREPDSRRYLDEDYTHRVRWLLPSRIYEQRPIRGVSPLSSRESLLPYSRRLCTPLAPFRESSPRFFRVRASTWPIYFRQAIPRGRRARDCAGKMLGNGISFHLENYPERHRDDGCT